jgi:hypothetical protein
MSNAAVLVIESRLAVVSERMQRAKLDKDRAGEMYGKASDYYKGLVQEELDLSSALECLADAQQEGVIAS